MRTKLLIVLAAVALVFTACKKDEPAIADNTIVYDGKTYQMETSLDPFNDNLAWLDAYNDEIQFMAYHVFPSAEFLCDKTYNDLTKEWPFFECHGALEMNTEHGDLEGQHYGTDMEWGTVFESGTAKRTYSNNTLSLEVNATLKNGKKFALKLTATSDWFHIDPNF